MSWNDAVIEYLKAFYAEILTSDQVMDEYRYLWDYQQSPLYRALTTYSPEELQEKTKALLKAKEAPGELERVKAELERVKAERDDLQAAVIEQEENEEPGPEIADS